MAVTLRTMATDATLSERTWLLLTFHHAHLQTTHRRDSALQPLIMLLDISATLTKIAAAQISLTSSATQPYLCYFCTRLFHPEMQDDKTEEYKTDDETKVIRYRNRGFH